MTNLIVAEHAQRSTTHGAPTMVRSRSGWPRLSLVITWQGNEEYLGALLSRRLGTIQARDVDVVVVTRQLVTNAVADVCRGVRFLVAPADVTTSRMREIGARQASGDVVMMVDDLADDASLDAVFAGRTADGGRRL